MAARGGDASDARCERLRVGDADCATVMDGVGGLGPGTLFKRSLASHPV
jgi:hypothetical protein